MLVDVQSNAEPGQCRKSKTRQRENEPININVKQTPHTHLSHASEGHAQVARPQASGR